MRRSLTLARAGGPGCGSARRRRSAPRSPGSPRGVEAALLLSAPVRGVPRRGRGMGPVSPRRSRWNPFTAEGGCRG